MLHQSIKYYIILYINALQIYLYVCTVCYMLHISLKKPIHFRNKIKIMKTTTHKLTLLKIPLLNLKMRLNNM